MPLNNPTPQSATRFPRAKILISGVNFTNWETVTVTKNSHYVSDNWEISAPINGLSSPMDAAFFATQSDLTADIQVGFSNPDGSAGAMTSLVTGLVDAIDLDFVTADSQQMLKIRGRDYSGALIDSVVTQNYINLTSSQVAQRIVANHPQLTGNITATTTPIGRYFNGESSLQSKKITEWDLLTQLAQFENNFVVLIRGTTLYFGPEPMPKTDNPYTFKYVPPMDGQSLSANVLTLSCQRALTLARDVQVVVQSFSRATGKTVKATVTASNKLRANRTGNKAGTQIFTYNIPNLNKAQAQQQAQSLADLITKRERIIEINAPGDPTLTPDTVVQLTGTNTDFDQLYYVDRLTHTLNIDEGYTMLLRAKNHSTASTLPT